MQEPADATDAILMRPSGLYHRPLAAPVTSGGRSTIMLVPKAEPSQETCR